MKKMLILIDGMSGSGKTTTTKLLLKKLPRTAHIGFDIIKKFISDFERGSRDNGIAREVVVVMAKKYLELGLSVIVDQPFRTEEEIKAYEQMAVDLAIPCYKFQLHAEPQVAFERVMKRTKERKGDLTEERVKRNISIFQSRSHLGFEMIDTTNLQPEATAEKILSKIF